VLAWDSPKEEFGKNFCERMSSEGIRMRNGEHEAKKEEKPDCKCKIKVTSMRNGG
jgi:hypothetical protein